jgi:hypothetical protein
VALWLAAPGPHACWRCEEVEQAVLCLVDLPELAATLADGVVVHVTDDVAQQLGVWAVPFELADRLAYLVVAAQLVAPTREREDLVGGDEQEACGELQPRPGLAVLARPPIPSCFLSVD